MLLDPLTADCSIPRPTGIDSRATLLLSGRQTVKLAGNRVLVSRHATLRPNNSTDLDAGRPRPAEEGRAAGVLARWLSREEVTPRTIASV